MLEGRRAKAGRWWSCSCEETTNQRTSFSQACCPISPRAMERRDRGLLPVQQLLPAPAWDQHGLSRRAAGRPVVPSSSLCFAYNQLGNTEALLCWSTIAEHCSRSSQRIRAVRKSCQRAANPYIFFFFFKLQPVILNCSMLSSPCESCTTILPLSSHACHGIGRCPQLGWTHPSGVVPQGALPTQDPCHLAQRTSSLRGGHPCPGASRGIAQSPANPGAGRASAAQPGCATTQVARRGLLSLGSTHWWEVGRTGV